MPEYLRALLVLMVVGAGYFYAARGALVPLLSEETFKRWRALWLVGTLVLFLSHGILLYFLILGIIVLAYRRREAHLLGMYFVLLFVAPPAPAEISGLGVIDHLWVVNQYRLMGVALLLPAALSLLQRNTTARLGSSPVDWMVMGYLVLMSMLAFRGGNVTDGLRSVLSLWVDIFLPFYVASRSIRSEEGLRHAMTGLLISAMILAIIAAFEMLRNWRLYSAVLGAIGVNQGIFGGYLTRSGLLRPNASVGNSIVLGYVIVVALGFFLYLKAFIPGRLHRFLGASLLVGGITASLSRGPWVGAVLLVIAFVLTGPKPVKHIFALGFWTVASFLLLSQLPSGQLLIDMLPVFGTAEQGNVEYRASLLTAALPVIERNLLFGSNNFLEAPELQVMMQGEGIIDLVNTYVSVALYSGMTGLLLFLGAFLFALFQVRRAVRAAKKQGSTLALLGRALFATLLTIMFIIYTVSSISAVPVVYWTVLGLSVAYAGFVAQQARPTKVAPVS